MSNLVLTGNSETFSKSDKNILAGSWCKQIQNFEQFSENYITINYHWENIAKVQKDKNYLTALYDKTLTRFSDFLNTFHGTNNCKRYWEIIIGYWLANSICVLYDRWEVIRCIFENENFDNIKILDLDESYLSPNSSEEFFREKILSHYWNHMIFFNILKHKNVNIKFDLIKVEEKVEKKSTPKKKNNFLRILDIFLKLIPKNNKILLYQSNFISNLDKIKIYISTGIMFRQYPEFSSNIKQEKFSRKKMNLGLDSENNFEEFLDKFLTFITPKSFLESFNDLKKKTNFIKHNPNIIFTSYGHFYNDFFKIWMAEKMLKGKKIIISTHGGQVEIDQSFNIQDNIADKSIYWTKDKSFLDNTKQMPPNFLLNKKKFLKTSKNLGDNLLFLTYEVEMYAHRIQDGPLSSSVLKSYEVWKKFIKNLNEKQLEKLKVRTGYGLFRDDWQIEKKLINLLGLQKISRTKKISQDFKKSKIIIHTSMQTTFLEAMKTGIPSIILFNKDLWNISEEMKILYQKMKSNNVIFTDPILLNKHLNKIWDDPLKWWNSKTIINLREEYSNICSIEKKDNLKYWINFFKKEQLNEIRD